MTPPGFRIQFSIRRGAGEHGVDNDLIEDYTWVD